MQAALGGAGWFGDQLGIYLFCHECLDIRFLFYVFPFFLFAYTVMQGLLYESVIQGLLSER
jgi:hypothetical protein